MEKIKFGLIGYGGAFSSTEENINNSFLLTVENQNEDETNILMIDCGEMNFHKVKSIIEKSQTKKIFFTIFITHLHPDHIGGLTTLYFYMKIIRPDINFKILSPSSKSAENLKTVMNIMGADIKGLENTVEDFSEKKEVIKKEKLSIIFEGHKVIHSENMECFGYKISLRKNNQEKNLWFSGDCRVEQSTAVKNIIENSHIIFHEMTIHTVPVHTNTDEYIKTYSKNVIGKTIPMHTGKEELKKIINLLEEKGFDTKFIRKFYSENMMLIF